MNKKMVDRAIEDIKWLKDKEQSKLNERESTGISHFEAIQIMGKINGLLIAVEIIEHNRGN